MGFELIEGDVRVAENGVSLATDDATALVTGIRGFINVLTDGTNTYFAISDSSGRQVIVGAGTAGTPAGGVVSIQGISGGTDVSVKQGTAAVVGAGWPIIISDVPGNPIVNNFDSIDGIYRLPITGKVSVSPPTAPPSTTTVSIEATPLDVTGTDDTTYTITASKTFHLQQVNAGAEGDPTDKGSKIEILYDDGSEHLIERIYVTGFTQFGIYPDTSTARDGTPLVGTGTETIIIRRDRLSGAAQEVDTIVRGFES